MTLAPPLVDRCTDANPKPKAALLAPPALRTLWLLPHWGGRCDGRSRRRSEATDTRRARRRSLPRATPRCPRSVGRRATRPETRRVPRTSSPPAQLGRESRPLPGRRSRRMVPTPVRWYAPLVATRRVIVEPRATPAVTACPACGASFADVDRRTLRPAHVTWRCPPGRAPRSYEARCPGCRKLLVLYEIEGGALALVASSDAVRLSREAERDAADSLMHSERRDRDR